MIIIIIIRITGKSTETLDSLTVVLVEINTEREMNGPPTGWVSWVGFLPFGDTEERES